MRLCHAEWQVGETKFGVEFDLGFGFGCVIDAVRAVNLGCNGFDLFLDGPIERVEEFKVALLFARVHYRFAQFDGALAAVHPVRAGDRGRAGFFGQAFDERDFGFGIVLEGVDRDDYRHTKQFGVLDVL